MIEHDRKDSEVVEGEKEERVSSKARNPLYEVYLKYNCGQYFQGRGIFSNMEKAILFCENFDFTPYPNYRDLELDIYEWIVDDINSGNLVYTLKEANVKE